MLEMVRSSISLFFRGKLFAEPSKAYMQLALGVLFTVVLFVAAFKITGHSVLLAAALSGFLGGALQPYLFRNLRYR